MNVRSIGSNEKGLNPKVERLNGTVRDRETVMRGIDTSEAARAHGCMRIHYNYCREHSQLGKTPAEQAGIKLDFDGNRLNLSYGWLHQRKLIKSTDG